MQQECSKGKRIYVEYIKRLKKSAKICLQSPMYLFHMKHFTVFIYNEQLLTHTNSCLDNLLFYITHCKKAK